MVLELASFHVQNVRKCDCGFHPIAVSDKAELLNYVGNFSILSSGKKYAIKFYNFVCRMEWVKVPAQKFRLRKQQSDGNHNRIFVKFAVLESAYDFHEI